MKENSVVQDESIPHCMFIAFNGLGFQLKDDVHSVLRIGSAHNKAGSPDIKIV